MRRLSLHRPINGHQTTRTKTDPEMQLRLDCYSSIAIAKCFLGVKSLRVLLIGMVVSFLGSESQTPKASWSRNMVAQGESQESHRQTRDNWLRSDSLFG